MPDDGGCLLVDLIAVRTIDNALLYGYQLAKKILGELIQRCPIF